MSALYNMNAIFMITKVASNVRENKNSSRRRCFMCGVVQYQWVMRDCGMTVFLQLLHVVEPFVVVTEPNEFIVCAALNNMSFVQHIDAVCILDG